MGWREADAAVSGRTEHVGLVHLRGEDSCLRAEGFAGTRGRYGWHGELTATKKREPWQKMQGLKRVANGTTKKRASTAGRDTTSRR